MAIEAGTSTYYQAKRGIVQDGLVLHLDAGVKESYSGGTVWRDLSGNGNNFTLYNGVDFDSIKGGRLIFDGTNSYVYSNNISLRLVHDVGEICYEILSYPLNYGALIFKGASHACRYEPHIASNGYCTFSGCGGSGAAHSSNANLINNTYYMLTFSVSETNNYAKTYLNGSISGNSTISGIKSNSNMSGYILNAGTSGNGFWIGCSNANGDPNLYASFLSGSISMIRIYNRPLLENEIIQNFNATRHRFGL